jgi:hypothetical protein
MSFLRDFGLPELLIILVACCLPIGVIGGVAVLVWRLAKNKKKQ